MSASPRHARRAPAWVLGRRSVAVGEPWDLVRIAARRYWVAARVAPHHGRDAHAARRPGTEHAAPRSAVHRPARSVLPRVGRARRGDRARCDPLRILLQPAPLTPMTRSASWESTIRRSGTASHFRVSRLRFDAPWAHLKVLTSRFRRRVHRECQCHGRRNRRPQPRTRRARTRGDRCGGRADPRSLSRVTEQRDVLCTRGRRQRHSAGAALGRPYSRGEMCEQLLLPRGGGPNPSGGPRPPISHAITRGRWRRGNSTTAAASTTRRRPRSSSVEPGLARSGSPGTRTS